MTTPPRENYRPLLGYFWMSVAVLIWASWLVLTSAGRATDLSVLDLSGFRALIPALILAPLLWRARRDVAGIGLRRCLLLSLYGLPFTLAVGYGLTMAPVAHAGALVPGMMPVIAAAIGMVFLGTRLNRRQLACYTLILLAAIVIMLQGQDIPGPGNATYGHALFLFGAVCWASFAITARSLDISPYLSTAIVGAVSSVVLIPIWLFSGLSNLDTAGQTDILFQAIFQGVFSGLVSLYAFAQGIRLLGNVASTFTALTPGVAALLAIPILGQVPSLPTTISLLIVVLALGLATRQPDKS